MKIRKMTLADIDALIEIGNLASELAVSDRSRFWGSDRLKPWIEAEQDIMIVAEDNGEVVGALITQLHMPSRVGLFSDLVVRESARGKGIGSALIEEALLQAKTLGISYVYGLTQTDNTKVQHLLTKAGFAKGETMNWLEKRI